MNNNLKKLIICAIFTALAFVTSSIVVFTNMAPFQHLFNVVLAVILGPEYAFLSALITGSMRMLFGGRTIISIIGGIFGAFLAGVGYKATKKLYMAFLGEIIGTGIISAIVSFYVMKYGFAVNLPNFYFYIPFFLPSSIIGATMGVIILVALKKRGLLAKYSFINENDKEGKDKKEV